MNCVKKASLSPPASDVRSIWQRHDLENFRKRLKALEEKVAKEGIVLSDAQITAFEKKALDDEASGEIETAHPGYLGTQDTFYVVNLKDVGRIYQQTFVDTYSKVAHCKLYTSKTPITAADLLNDQVLAFYEAQGLPILRILTDRGTEYCGKVEQHDYLLYLAISDDDHTKTEMMSPQTKGIYERFNKTLFRNFIRLHSARSDMQTYKACKWIWTTDCGSTIMSELLRGKMYCERTPITPMATLPDGNGSGQKRI